MILGLLLLGPFTVCADPDGPDLFLREVKITGDEFVVLQANRAISLNDYWLGYTGSDTATNIVPTEQLPTRTLQAGQALLLTSDGALTCDAVQVAKLSFSLSDTKGTLVVRQLQSSGNTSTFTTVDSVSWAKSTSSTKISAPIDVSKEVGLGYPVWFQDGTGVNGWRVGNFADCSETFAATDTAPVTTVTWPQNQTDIYGGAKDGLAWALAKGSWYWTAKTTPNSPNVINQTATATKTIKTTSAQSAAAAVKGAATSKSPLQKGMTASASAAVAPAPIHAGVLAAVAALAVGYGVYEYRHDLANHFHQFRQHRAARRKARS